MKTVEFLVGVARQNLEELLDEYKFHLYELSMYESDVEKVREYYKKLVRLEEEYGKMAADPVSCVIGDLREPTTRDLLRKRVEELNRISHRT